MGGMSNINPIYIIIYFGLKYVAEFSQVGEMLSKYKYHSYVSLKLELVRSMYHLKFCLRIRQVLVSSTMHIIHSISIPKLIDLFYRLSETNNQGWPVTQTFQLKKTKYKMEKNIKRKYKIDKN